MFVSEVTYLLMLAREYSVKPVYYGRIQVLVVLVVVSSEDSKYIRTWCCLRAVRELSVAQHSRAPSVEKTCDDVICGQK